MIEIHPHLRSILTRGQLEAYRIFSKRKIRNGEPLVCWGMYRWIAPQGTKANWLSFISRNKGSKSPRRKRPEWCSRKLWQAFREYQRKVRSDITIEEYSVWKKTGKRKDSKFIDRARPGKILERPVSDILAKFARMGFAPKPKP